MAGNQLIMFIKRRIVLSISMAVILMVSAWGISYYVFLAQGNSTYKAKSREIMMKVGKINSELEILSGKTGFLDGNISSELNSFIDSSSKDILNLQSQLSGLKYTPSYTAQAKNINELLNQESSTLNSISQIVRRPLDFENTKSMTELRDKVTKVERLIYEIDMPQIIDKSDSLEGIYRNISVFLQANIRNSMDEAYKISKRELGNNIIQAIPFAFNEKSYIAVRRSENQENLNYNVIVLQSQGSYYVETWRNSGILPLSDGNLQAKLFTIQDIDRDEKPDVTYFNQGSETGGMGAMLAVYSVAKNVEYTITVSQMLYYTKGSRQQIQVSDNLKLTENKIVFDWIKNTLVQNHIIIPEITPNDMLKDPNLAGDLWYKENVDLHGNGKVKIHWYDGEAPNKGKETSKVSDGAMVYKAYFKDGVYATDTQNNKFYVVYIPENQYDWIEKLEIGDNELVMYTRQVDDQPGITYYFDITTQKLAKR